MSKDYYDILHVAKDASQADIKKAYRQLAFKYHPDRNKGDKDKEELFKEASEAYQVLSDSQKKSQYDRFGHGAFNGQGGFEDVSDIFSSFKDIFNNDFFGSSGSSSGGFEDLFGFSGHSHGPSKGTSLHHQIELDLKDLLTGTSKDISFYGKSQCSNCKGSGAKPGTQKKTCPQCQGQGQKISRKGMFSFSTTCSHCQGQGKVLDKPCGGCYGKGIVQDTRTLNVKIPPGIDHGTRLRLQGEGEPGTLGGPSGDFYLEVYVKPHSHFIKKGRNIETSLNVTYLQALLGTEKTIQGLTGEETVRIPPGTQPGSKIKLPHQGLPSLNNPTRGDLLCIVQIKIPKKLKKKEEECLRQIAELKKESILKKKTSLF